MEDAGSIKHQLRREVLARRKKLTVPQRVLHSAEVLQRVFDLEVMERAEWVHFYCSAGSEVETSGMIAHALRSGKRVSVPRMDSRANRLVLSEVLNPAKELLPNSAGIPEPLEAFYRPVGEDRMDLFVIPGVAFDMKGGRLGKGKGYYDRLLAPLVGGRPVV
ncbi:MAG TPA: 5-formyltetrahydrofolate cyclo-ligase, partial [Nitrospiria bacterium]|nr:5-formyltetrahydrofolate cyclo-ligase [Nitrospiria bacterium]